MEYQNPVYSDYFSDPFVWKSDDRYYAIGGGKSDVEGERVDAKCVFPLLESQNLADWRPRGKALAALPLEYGNAYWAPEIAHIEGKYWMYYSIGRNDKAHHLRVAVSEHACGPYADTGTRLTNPFVCPFAIDPSPFQDDDGSWYLFYARDFLDTERGARVGTGVVVDRLVRPTELAGDPRVVVRPSYDWQRFKRDRIMYGAVYDWHTVEGPCTRKRLGKYWCLYSAGCWQNETYGVDFASAGNVLGPYMPGGDNSHAARVLRTVPGRVIGPGHNSIVAGPDGRTEYIVYHAWDSGMTGRRMCIDPIEWTPDGPRTPGPTYTPQPLR